jgi:hypothetical protein
MKFNRKLWKHMKLSEHVTILESPQDWVYYTRHGLHFNGYGKETICSQLALSIGNLFQYTEVPPTRLGWEDKTPTSVEMTAHVTCNELSNIVSKVVVADSSTTTEHNTYKISTRQKKLPANRTDYFLWQF